MISTAVSDLIGLRLHKQREARRITLEDAAATLRIRLRYVQALDKGDLSIFPSPVQARGFLRSYVQYLGLDAAPFLAALDGDTSLLEEGERAADGLDGETDGLEAEPLEGELPAPDGAGSGPEGEISPDEAAETAAAPDAQASQAGRPDAGERKPPASGYPKTKFEQIGQNLRRQRETLGLSLDDVERHTRLRVFYLKALEAGSLDELPSPVQGRGMLKNYASFLGLDVEALLLQFAEGLQARLAARPGLRILKRAGHSELYAPMGSPQPRLITTDLLLAGVLVLFLVAFIAWGVIRITAMRTGQQPTITAPAIADVLAQLGTPSVTPLGLAGVPISGTLETTPDGGGQLQVEATEGGDLPPSPTLPPEFSNASVQVIVSVVMRAWMRVTVDGKVVFDGRVLPGSAFPFAGDERIEVLTGNGAGLEVNFNQTELGALGTFGEAVQRVFTVQGMQTPTATVTRTPAPVTPTPSITPTP